MTKESHQSSRSSRSIAFVVDDEDVIASTLELILLSEGFEARSFVDPHDALVASQTSTPDLLLTDVLMPGINGIELGDRGDGTLSRLQDPIVLRAGRNRGSACRGEVEGA